MKLDKYLVKRILKMRPWEVPVRVGELSADYLRYWYARSPFYRPPKAGPQRFSAIIRPAPRTMLQQIWDANPWHERALVRLLANRFEANGMEYERGGDNPWNWCPDRRSGLSLHMGRTYLFSKMYRQANMQYVGTLNRHYHLIHLAKAAHLGRVDADHVIAEIRSWIRFNPYLAGVNWSDTLNTSVRLTNWMLAFSILGVDEIPEDIAVSVLQQLKFVESHLSFGSSAANHLLGELWGLLFVAMALPGLPGIQRVQQRAAKRFAVELRRQFDVNGFHRERSVSYHRYILEYFLLLLIGARNTNTSLPPLLDEIAFKGIVYLGSLVTSRGEVPFIGDYGHEVTTDLHYQSFWTNDLYRSTFALARAYFGQRDIGPEDTGSNEQRVPWFIADSTATSERRELRRLNKAINERASGVAVLRDERRDADVQVTYRCGEMGYQSLCAHAHADMLSITAAFGGMMFLVDPGTYDYVFVGGPWREYFKGTRAHNTLAVEGENQALSAGAMIWETKVNGVIDERQTSGDSDSVCGHHDGYLRNPLGARHRRCVTVDRQRRALRIEDWLETEAERQVELHFHLHPEVEVEPLGDNYVSLHRGGRTVKLSLPGAYEVFYADEQTLLGWYAPYLGIKEGTHTLRVQCSLGNDDRLVAELCY